MSTMPTLDRSAVEALAGSVSSRLLQAGDDGYDEARRVHNGLVTADRL